MAATAAAQLNPDVITTLENTDWSDILTSQQPDLTWQPSKVYQSPDLIQAVDKMTATGVGEYKLIGGLSDDDHRYALVNIAAFLAQSMHETIKYDACDENNWDQNSGYTAANACGQLGQSYQDYKCPAGEEHMACEVDPEMELVATTNAKWYGAPGQFFCAPKSKVPKAPKWDHGSPWCDPNVDRTLLQGDDFFANVNGDKTGDCNVYEGQQSGGWTQCEGAGCANAAAPAFGQEARTDVEGCCWWGRGVIQTTGVCNFGKLNYFAGARAAREGRESLFPDVDFCRTPNKICDSVEHPDLKWVAGLFFWTKEVQLYPTNDQYNFDYEAEMRAFADAGNINDRDFIDKVSGIVNRGCPSAHCPSGHVHEASKRAENFQTVLRAFGYPFGATPQPTTQKPATTSGSSSTSGSGSETDAPSPSGGSCSGSCSSCVAVPGNDQAAIDSHCAPCANGQTWWPCNLENVCQCADAAPETDAPSTDAPTTEAPTTEAPTTAAPTTEAATTQAPTTQESTTTKYTTKDCTTTESTTTEAPVTTTVAPVTTAPVTTTKYETQDCEIKECDANCNSCIAIPGNSQNASNDHCAACANAGQSWWPCDIKGLCMCNDARNLII